MGKNWGKSWSRKRKVEERTAKVDKERKDNGYNHNGRGGYTAVPSNAKFEAYYSLVGLHDSRYDRDTQQFVPCTSDEEKHAERELFMATVSDILPASFRVDRSLDPTIQNTILEELQQLVGREMELEVELPRKSAVFGDTANNNLAKSKGSNDDDDDDEYDVEHPTHTKADFKSAHVDNEGPTIVKKTIAPAKPIPFISCNNKVLGFQLSIDKRTLRRNKSLEPLFTWLKIQSDCGHITRQETVSMIPPVVLDAKEGMSVLDMCAAPGSKTCQILEVVGGLPKNDQCGHNGDGSAVEPTGYVVANDSDPKRAYMLVTQLRRMNSPSVFVTSCDGRFFPILDDKSVRGTNKEGMFDRVLCDVPCSGDGTMRKNPGIWKHWNQLGSLAIHPLQLEIALRGARLTRVGGYLVYSTCSMNPMENESVVSALLRIADGALVLEDPRGRMEGLLARPGWSSWRVLRESSSRTRRARKDMKKKNSAKMQERRKEWEKKAVVSESTAEKQMNNKDEEGETNEMSPYDTIPYCPPATWDEDALVERTKSLGFVEYRSYDDVEPEWQQRVRASCFPPTDEEAKRFQLHKCLRSLPQDMDTGGFFVALLKKVKPIKLSTESTGRIEATGDLGLVSNIEEGSDQKLNHGDGSADATITTYDQTDDSPTQLLGGGENVTLEDAAGEENNLSGKTEIPRANKKKRDLGTENFVHPDPSVWPPIVEEYGLAATFPKDQFMVRESGEAKVLYFISKSIKEELIDRGVQDRVRVINSGLKGFERCTLQDSTASHRVAQEGLQYVLPHMTKRVLKANMDDFYNCVKEGFISFDLFTEAFQQGLDALTPGCFIATLDGYEEDLSKKMFLVMWRRPNKMVNCFVSKVEMDAIFSKMRALGYVAKEAAGEGLRIEDTLDGV